jgi:hypothetical protein
VEENDEPEKTETIAPKANTSELKYPHRKNMFHTCYR